MADHYDGQGRGDHDPLDNWLAAHVPPLLPPPGTLERIRRRARRRKLRRAAGAAAGAALVIAGIAVLPRVALPQVNQPLLPRGTAASENLPTPTPAHHQSPPPSPSPSPSPSAPTSAAATPAQPAVPANFAPTSVTFVGTRTGWVVGQAGIPGHCTGPNPDVCTSIARTDDGGRTWHGVPAPVTGPPDGARGASQIRFLNTGDGWVFGPELWATHDGGQSWAQIPTHGLRVTDLETVGGTAYAVWAHCTGGGASYAAGCSSFTLYSSPAGSDQWRPAPGAARHLPAGRTPSAALLLLTGSTGYLLPPTGALLTAPATGAGRWQPAAGLVNTPPCSPGASGQAGAAGGALLAITGTSRLVLLCPGTGSPGRLYASADRGQSWQSAGQVTAPGTAASLSGSLSGALVLATSEGISISPDGGSSWHSAHVSGSPPGGFSYVGMTTADQGVAVPADPHQGAIWFTYDGGRRWQPSPVR